MERWFPIETQRLLLREFTASDESDVHEYASDPEVCKYEHWGPNTPEITRIRCEERLELQKRWPRDVVQLAIELREEHKVIGSIELRITDPENKTADFGYHLNRRYWNRGYMTEAATVVLDAAFSKLKLHRVWATCDTRNGASFRVLEKLGMRREGHFVRDKFQKGEWRDSYLYAILADERFSKDARKEALEVDLKDVDERILEELRAVASSDAALHEVMPPVVGGPTWSAIHDEYFRAFHRQRRDLDGPTKEKTFAIMLDGRVIGSARLARIDSQTLECGLWIARSVRGKGAAASVLGQLLATARSCHARSVIAKTRQENARAVRVLRSRGALLTEPDAQGNITASFTLDI